LISGLSAPTPNKLENTLTNSLRITFVRHGNTNKAENDLDRQLTDRGHQQAIHRGKRLALGSTFDLGLSSHAVRAIVTRTLLLEAQDDPEGIPVTEAAELYAPTGEDGDRLDELVAEIGSYLFRPYWEKDAKLFQRYAGPAIRKIRDAAMETDARNILVVGHAILLNALGFMLTSDVRLLDFEIGECQGFVLENGQVTHLFKD